MRVLTLVVSAVFLVIGIAMVRDGNSPGWFVAGFFGLGLLIAVLEPHLRRHRMTSVYRLVITPHEVACEHPKRWRESIRWADVNRIWYVTSADGPRLPDEWILLEGENAGCSFPTEASGMDTMWDELERRFPGFDYKPLTRGPVTVARQLCWERR